MTILLNAYDLAKKAVLDNVDSFLQEYQTTKIYRQVVEITDRFLDKRKKSATETGQQHLSMMTTEFKTVNKDTIQIL